MAVPTEIRYDQSGELATGYFYSLICEWPRPNLGLQDETDWIVSAVSREDFGYYYGEVVFSDKFKWHNCSLHPTHFKRVYRSREVDLSGVGLMPPMLPAIDDVLVNEDLAAQLVSSGLTGFGLHLVSVTNNSIVPSQPLPLFALSFFGTDTFKHRLVIPQSGNKCPSCGHGPVLCPNCRQFSFVCQACGKSCAETEDDHDGPGDPRIKVQLPPERGPVVDAKLWDGSDFLGSTIITRRALDWLLSIHAGPFKAQPLRTDIEGLSAEDLDRLESARQPVRRA